MMMKINGWLSKLQIPGFGMKVFSIVPTPFRLQGSDPSIVANVKPGRDLYFWMFVIELFLVIYLLILYTVMAEQSATPVNPLTASRFSGSMVLWVFIQMVFMVADRVVTYIYFFFVLFCHFKLLLCVRFFCETHINTYTHIQHTWTYIHTRAKKRHI